MSSDSEQLRQDEIEQLLQQARNPQPEAAGAAPAAPTATASVEDAAAAAALKQDEIESLLAKSKASATGAKTASKSVNEGPSIAQGDIELLLEQAERALASVADPAQPLPGLREFTFEDFSGAPPSTEAATLDLIRDVELDVRIELGRTHLFLEDVLKLRKGSVVSLDKLAGDPVDIYVNGRHVARGEVLVLNDNFCVRVAELIVGQAAKAG